MTSHIPPEDVKERQLLYQGLLFLCFNCLHIKPSSQSNHSGNAFTQKTHNVSFSPFPSELPFEREEFGDKLLQIPICLNYKHLKKTPFSLRESGGENTWRGNVKCGLWSRIIRWHFIELSEGFSNDLHWSFIYFKLKDQLKLRINSR